MPLSPLPPAASRRVLLFAVTTLLASAGQRQAGAAGQAMFAEPSIYLTAEPRPVSILVQDIGALRGFELSLAYDADHVAITAIGVGGLVSAVRPEAQLTVVEAGPGTLTVGLALDERGSATPTGDGMAAPPPLFPQGSGELVSVTLAPLKQTEGSVALTVTALRILDAGQAGEEDVDCPPAQVTVAQDPSDAQRAAFLEQADTLRPSGFLDGSWLPALPSGLSPELAWLGLVAAGLGLAGMAWAIGRRPASQPPRDG